MGLFLSLYFTTLCPSPLANLWPMSSEPHPALLGSPRGVSCELLETQLFTNAWFPSSASLMRGLLLSVVHKDTWGHLISCSDADTHHPDHTNVCAQGPSPDSPNSARPSGARAGITLLETPVHRSPSVFPTILVIVSRLAIWTLGQLEYLPVLRGLHENRWTSVRVIRKIYLWENCCSPNFLHSQKGHSPFSPCKTCVQVILWNLTIAHALH